LSEPGAATSANEDTRQRQIALGEVLLREQKDRIDCSVDELHDVRAHALRALLAHATTRSPWHRERLSGLDPNGVSEADVESLPTMTKADLMESFDDVVTDRRVTRELCDRHLANLADHEFLLGEHHVVASGGASGQRGVFVYGFEAWAILWASIVRFQQREWDDDATLADVPRVTAVVAASNPSHISAAVGRTFSTARNPRHLFPVDQRLEHIVAGLNALQPTILMGYSSFLAHLALEAHAGRLRIAPRRVTAISEPLLPETRAALYDAWGAPIANGYGMSEGAFTGWCGHGTHLPDDLCLLEPVDEAGRPVRPGTPGARLYLTNLYNSVLPLIRYEVTDEITILEEPCPCGSSLRRIADPQGRLDDTFIYGHGVTIHPHVFRSLLGKHHEIVEYQVRQTRRGAAVEIVSRAPLDTSLVARELHEALVALGLREPDVTVRRAATLGRHPTGKLKRFVPLDP
jgi:phenylacetate-coenzyme A ligase PaaK-like adenylate-forming protein